MFYANHSKQSYKALKTFIITIICLTIFTACTSTDSQNAISDEKIESVKNGQPYDYQEQTIGEAFDDYFSSQEWIYFVGEDDREIVEFNGIANSIYEDSFCLQFEILGDEFEVVYVGLNGTDQSYEFMYLLFDDIFGLNAFEEESEIEPYEEEEPENVPEESELIIEAIDNKLIYNDILWEISQAIEDGDNFSTLSDKNLSQLLFYYTLDTLGYAFSDINADGTDELLIGEVDGETGSLVALYYINNDEVTLALNGGERDYYKLCSDGLIANQGSSAADNTSLLTFQLTPYGLVVVNDERTKDFYNLTDEYYPTYSSLSTIIWG